MNCWSFENLQASPCGEVGHHHCECSLLTDILGSAGVHTKISAHADVYFIAVSTSVLTNILVCATVFVILTDGSASVLVNILYPYYCIAIS